MLVPFLDLQAHHAPIRAELLASIEEVLSTDAFAEGPFVAKFESEFASYCQTRHAVGVGSGTEALWFCLLACGIGPGDE
ncbi:MAG TPA: DegT/DnrJ/EryC1/StrS family aminotransferase, partial [Opitutaceae bacterium]